VRPRDDEGHPWQVYLIGRAATAAVARWHWRSRQLRVYSERSRPAGASGVLLVGEASRARQDLVRHSMDERHDNRVARHEGAGVWRGSLLARTPRVRAQKRAAQAQASRGRCAGARLALLATVALFAAVAFHGRAADAAAGLAGRAFAILVGVDDFSQTEGLNDLPACVNDALGITAALATQALYTAPEGEARVHVFLAPRSGELGVRPAEVLNARVHVGFEEGSASVLAALSEVAQQATRAEDLVLVYVATHGAFVEAESGQQLRFLLPDYRPDRSNTFVTFDQLANGIRGVKAQVVFLLNACQAGGDTGGASEGYFERLLRESDGYRCVIPSCARDEQSWIGPGRAQSLFGECVIEALQGRGLHEGQTEVAVHNFIEYLVDCVGKRAAALGKQQTLTYQSVRQYAAGNYARVVLANVAPAPHAPAAPSGPPVVTPLPGEPAPVGPTLSLAIPPCFTEADQPAGRPRKAVLGPPAPHARLSAAVGRVALQPAAVRTPFPAEPLTAAPPHSRGELVHNPRGPRAPAGSTCGHSQQGALRVRPAATHRTVDLADHRSAAGRHRPP